MENTIKSLDEYSKHLGNYLKVYFFLYSHILENKLLNNDSTIKRRL